MAEWLKKNAYDILRGWLQRVCGLTVPEQREQRLIDAVRSRLTELSLDVPDAYCRYLSSLADPCDEVRRLACQLTVGETYFLRNKDHWRALTTCVLPWLIERQRARAQKRLRL